MICPKCGAEGKPIIVTEKGQLIVPVPDSNIVIYRDGDHYLCACGHEFREREALGIDP